MILNNFEFIKCNSLDEVLNLLKETESNGRVIAGGTDIIPGMIQNSSRFSNIERLIDINGVEELKSVIDNKDSVLIGAGLTFSEILNNDLLKSEFPLLTKAVSLIGSKQIRNKATVGGNIVNNAPCADSLSPLLCYDSSLIIQSKHLRKQVLLKDFLQESYKTLLGSDEIITSIQIPKISNRYKGKFYKLGRRRGVAISRLSLSILIFIEDNIIKDIRIAGGAVTPVAMRFDEVENLACTKHTDQNTLKLISREIGKKVLDITGLRWSSAYKLPVIQRAVYNLLNEIITGENQNDKN